MMGGDDMKILNYNFTIMGHSGSGKTTLSKIASQYFNCPLVDVDKKIDQYFENYSATRVRRLWYDFHKASYRYFKSKKVVDVIKSVDRDAILSLGGNDIIRPGVREALQDKNFSLVFFSVPLDVLLQRFENVGFRAQRGHLLKDNWREIVKSKYSELDDVYREKSNVIIPHFEEKPEQTFNRILSIIPKLVTEQNVYPSDMSINQTEQDRKTEFSIT